jgi:transcriptional regulator with XRE-family HTH domain
LEVLSLLVETFEREHYPIPTPDPISAIEHYMESRGLTRKDLEPFIGSRARVSEVMTRRRPLTLGMIRRLAAGLRIPTDVLIQPYPLPSNRDLQHLILFRTILDLSHVQVVNQVIHSDPSLLRPLPRSQVAGHKIGGHTSSLKSFEVHPV